MEKKIYPILTQVFQGLFIICLILMLAEFLKPHLVSAVLRLDWLAAAAVIVNLLLILAPKKE